MSDSRTRITLDGNAVHVVRVGDVSPTLDYAAEQRNLPNPKGERFWPKWTIPPETQEKFYTMYVGTQLPPPPMDSEFWAWVDKKIMTDPDYSKYRLANTSNPFFMGYKK